MSFDSSAKAREHRRGESASIELTSRLLADRGYGEMLAEPKVGTDAKSDQRFGSSQRTAAHAVNTGTAHAFSEASAHERNTS